MKGGEAAGGGRGGGGIPESMTPGRERTEGGLWGEGLFAWMEAQGEIS